MASNPVDIAAQIVTLSASGLFDAAWYRAQYPDAPGDPLVDFCNEGWLRGRRPNFYFDSALYLAIYEDVRRSGQNPLGHYFAYGEAEGRAPSAHFDPAWYRAHYHTPADVCCLADYLARRRGGAVSPNAGFDASWYRAAYGQAADEDVFQSYIEAGAASGRWPSLEAKVIAQSGLFDHDFYPAASPETDGGAVYHFCRTGWRLEQRAPNPAFDTAWYLAMNEDVRNAGANPLLHYIEFGEAEDRQPSPDFNVAAYRERWNIPRAESCLAHYLASGAGRRDQVAAAAAAPTGAATSVFYEDELVLQSGLFDTNYYLINYPDVRQSPLHPVEHFRQYGWREGRRPNPYFDPLWYSETYLASDPALNPLLDYIRAGEHAGHRPVIYFDPLWYRARNQLGPAASPLRHFLEHRRSQRYSPNPWFDAAWYMRKYGGEVGPNRDPFAHYLRVGISHDVDPSPEFSAKSYRMDNMPIGPARANPTPGAEVHERLRREGLNPLVHFLMHDEAALARAAA
jgi:hypothetical protein